MGQRSTIRSRRALCAALLTFVLPCATVLPPVRAAASTDGITGVWLTEDRDSKVELSISGSGPAATPGGKVVWLAQTARDGRPQLDVNNSDPSLRSRPVMGLALLSGFSATAAGSWRGGSVYAPRSGKTFPPR